MSWNRSIRRKRGGGVRTCPLKLILSPTPSALPPPTLHEINAFLDHFTSDIKWGHTLVERKGNRVISSWNRHQWVAGGRVAGGRENSIRICTVYTHSSPSSSSLAFLLSHPFVSFHFLIFIAYLFFFFFSTFCLSYRNYSQQSINDKFGDDFFPALLSQNSSPFDENDTSLHPPWFVMTFSSFSETFHSNTESVIPFFFLGAKIENRLQI